MAGLVFFSWIASYWEDLIFYFSASLITIVTEEPKTTTIWDLYSIFPVYKFNLIFKTIMNLLGWIIVGLYYGDFCDHIDYMNEYLNATKADLKAAEEI